MEDKNTDGTCPIGKPPAIDDIHEIMDLCFPQPSINNSWLVAELISAISQSKSKIEGVGIYKAKHLKGLFDLAGANIPPEYPVIRNSSDETLIQFPNTMAAVLCLDALNNDSTDLIERSSIAASILSKRQESTTETNGSLQEMHELVDVCRIQSSEQLVEDTIGYIPFSKGGLGGTGTYTAGHLKKLFALAGTNIPLECPEISSSEDAALVTLHNTIVTVLCLDAMKKQNIPITARGFLVDALFTPPLSQQSNLHMAPETP